MAPPQTDPLLRAGLEGFADIDRMFPRQKRFAPRPAPGYQGYQYQYPGNYQTPREKEEPVPVMTTLTSKEAAKLFGGVEYLEFNSKGQYRRTQKELRKL